MSRDAALGPPDTDLTRHPGTRTVPGANQVLVLLGLFSALNFGDKAILGLAGPAIMDDLGLSNTQFGAVASSFYLLFSVSALLVGLFGTRWPATWMLAGMALVWSVAQLPLLLPAAGFATLVATRILLGGGEGPGIPMANHLAFTWWAPQRRTMVSGVLAASGALGVILGGPVLAVVIVVLGWRWAFGLLGLLGIGWAAMWLLWGGVGPFTVDDDAGTASPASAPAPARDAPSLLEVLLTRTTLVAVTAGFGGQWMLGLAMSWLPSYLENAQGFEPRVVGILVGLPSAVAVVTVPLVILGQRRLAARGLPARVIYPSLGLAVTLVPAVALLVIAAGASRPVVLVLAAVAFGVVVALMPLLLAALADMAPYLRRGSVLCVATAVSSLGAVAAPWVTGRLLDLASTDAAGYAAGFRLAAAFCVAAGLVLLLLDPERDALRWRSEG